ncbi:hypothetical protein GIB67_020214 [Kingdonia uniflora]|uniref:Protein kinase domain-containing protein n=1 Tax=Kingdonia uniflora TaxID=39325 RepID=A0A7J7P128_9MAGN|nr:hypothetical protein GIB67_020214 [Kingdonia uniflora]
MEAHYARSIIRSRHGAGFFYVGFSKSILFIFIHVFVFSVIIFIIICVFQEDDVGATKQHVKTQIEYKRISRLPIEFQYKDLEKATNNFRYKLGSGGSGAVYKGKLDDGTSVAVKRVVRPEYGEGEFTAEITAIAGVDHINLVRLRGYSTHMEKGGMQSFFIVYDFYPIGSLEKWIFPKNDSPTSPFLSWKSRYEVAVDVGKALIYLHRQCCQPILHLDLKPENILLEPICHDIKRKLIHQAIRIDDVIVEDLRGILSDFGLSQLMNEEYIRFYPEITRGSPGYMAPEWFSRNGISEKCDYFSYGKVLLDLFFGQSYVSFDINGNRYDNSCRNSQPEWSDSYKFMQHKLKMKEIRDLIDKRLTQVEFDMREATTLFNAALWCLKENPNDRPGDMQRVVNMLEHLKECCNQPPADLSLPMSSVTA